MSKKDYQGRKSRPNEVDCITGATISSEAVVGIPDPSTAKWMPRLTAMTEERADGR